MKKKIETAVTVIVTIIVALPEILAYIPHKKKYYSFKAGRRK